MSKTETVNMASSVKRTPGVVKSRETLKSGEIIRILVPESAEMGVFKSENLEIHYLQFVRPVKGGLVNFFVQTKDDCRGKNITARVSVMRKTFTDERSFLYIDLFPETTSVTRRLAVLTEKPSIESNWEIFKTPEPLRGFIVLAPPDAKIAVPKKAATTLAPSKVTNVEITEAIPAMLPSLPLVAIGNSTLTKLIRVDGWTIESVDEKTVLLSKIRDGKQVTMIYDRPQPKKRK